MVPETVFVRASLPKGAQFGRENFAGDPLVKSFFEIFAKENDLNAEIFVSWACPPDVRIVRTKDKNILIRSERFDTLLVEYLHLYAAYNSRTSTNARSALIATYVLRWMAEFLIGYRQPSEAIAAIKLCRDKYGEPTRSHAFRDESLASIPDIEKTALQSFCLAHELAHILYPRNPGKSLDDTVDGLSISRHIERDWIEAGHDPALMWPVVKEGLSAPTLFSEIDADLCALDSTIAFLLNTFSCPLQHAVHAALFACMAQWHIYASKNTCRLISKAVEGELDEHGFVVEDFLYGTQTMVRARCVLRRAGITWARFAYPDRRLTANDINQFVPLVDQLFIDDQEFIRHTETVFCEYAAEVRQETQGLDKAAAAATFKQRLDHLQSDSDLRLDFFYLLIAFGLPGGTDVVTYLDYIYKRI